MKTVRQYTAQVVSFAKRPNGFRVVFFIVVLLAAVVSVQLAFRHAGWPVSHEGLTFEDRTRIYAEHFKQGDLFPIWSSVDAQGLGTPLPLFYHKLFYYISGTFYLISGAMKVSLALTILLLMFVGAYGIRACVRHFTASRWLLLAGPVAFLLANYTFTNWLIRGAMAEFSAMMLLPWCIWWCLKLIRQKQFSLWIIPIMFLLFHAHNITAVVAGLVCVLAGIVFLVGNHAKQDWLYVAKRAAVAAVAVLALLSPTIVMQKIFLDQYDPSKITQMNLLASQNFVKDSTRYLYEDGYVWLHDWKPFMVQIDFGISFGILIFIVATVVVWRRKGGANPFKMLLRRPEVLFLAAVGLLFMFLQLPISSFVFHIFWPLQFLQFPWRTLSLVTIAGILIVVVGLAALAKSKRYSARTIHIVIAAWVASFIVLSPVARTFQYPFYWQWMVEGQNYSVKTGIVSRLEGIGEYLPRVHDKQGKELSTYKTYLLYKDFTVLHKSFEALYGGSCTLKGVNGSPKYEELSRHYQVTCAGKTELALPFSYAKYYEIYLDGKLQKYFRTPDDPRIRITKLQSGTSELVVNMPTISIVAKNLLQ